MMNRRNFLIRSIGAAIVAGMAPSFIPSLVSDAVGDVFHHPGGAVFTNIENIDTYALLKSVYGPAEEFVLQMSTENHLYNFIKRSARDDWRGGGVLALPKGVIDPAMGLDILS